MSKRILIIEDDKIINNVIEFLLKKEGYEIEIARDGNEGLEKIVSYNPDLIITDIMLPYKSGLEVTSFVKQHYPSIPLIIISSLGKEDLTIIEAFKLGADDLVAKPFNPVELILRVKRLFLYSLVA
jgi:two-component system, OmpR family, response regulator VicR